MTQNSSSSNIDIDNGNGAPPQGKVGQHHHGHEHQQEHEQFEALAAPPVPKTRVLRGSVSTQSFKHVLKSSSFAGSGATGGTIHDISTESGNEERPTSESFHFNNSDSSNPDQATLRSRTLTSKSSVESIGIETAKRGDSLSQMWSILQPRLRGAMEDYRALEVETPVQWISPSNSSWVDGTGSIDPDSGSLTLKTLDGAVAAVVPDLRTATVIGSPRKRYMEIIVPAMPELERAGTRLILAPTSESDFVQWLAVLLLWSHLKPAGLISKVTTVPGSLSNRSDRLVLFTEFEVYFPYLKQRSSISGDRDSATQSTSSASSRLENTVFSKAKYWKPVKGLLTLDGIFRLIMGEEFDQSEREVYVVDMKHILSSRVRQVDSSLFDKRRVLYLQSTGGILVDNADESLYVSETSSSSSSSVISDHNGNTISTSASRYQADSHLQEKLYMCFPTEKDYERWFYSLREFTKHRVFQSGQETIRIARQINARVLEARFDGSVTVPTMFDNTYVEVSFENTVWARTSVHANGDGNPYWRENFFFNDFPIMSPNFEFTLKKRGRRKQSPSLDEVIGSVTVTEQSIRHATDSEQWLPLKLSGSTQQPCSLCLRISYEETKILPAASYAKIEEQLEDISNGLTMHISEQTGDISQVSDVCLKIMLTSRGKKDLAMEWLMMLIGHELRKVETQTKPSQSALASCSGSSNECGEEDADSNNGPTLVPPPLSSSSSSSSNSTASLASSSGQPSGTTTTTAATTFSVTNTLFRGNSLLTKSLERYMKLVANDYLDSTIGKLVRRIVTNGLYMEIDPERLHNHPQSSIEKTVRENQQKLEYYATQLWQAIYESLDRIPRSFKLLFHRLKLHLIEELHQEEYLVYNSVAGFLFLRFFCPALLNPKLFGLIRSHPPSNVQRSLTLITKLLQGFANRVRFGLKEPWMIPMNSFIDAHEEELIEFYRRVTLPSDSDEGKDTNIIHRFDSSEYDYEKYASDGGTSDDNNDSGHEEDGEHELIAHFSKLAFESSPASEMRCNVSLPFLIDRSENLAKLVQLWGSNRPAMPCDECTSINTQCNRCITIKEFSNQCSSLLYTTKSSLRILKAAESIDDISLDSVHLKHSSETGKVMLASTQLATSGLKHMHSGKHHSHHHQQQQGQHSIKRNSGSRSTSHLSQHKKKSGSGDDPGSYRFTPHAQRLANAASPSSSTLHSTSTSDSKRSHNHGSWGRNSHNTSNNSNGNRRSSVSIDEDERDADGQKRAFRWSRFTTVKRRS